jgi:hypothetical protein
VLLFSSISRSLIGSNVKAVGTTVNYAYLKFTEFVNVCFKTSGNVICGRSFASFFCFYWEMWVHFIMFSPAMDVPSVSVEGKAFLDHLHENIS